MTSDDQDIPRMTLADHLDELRKRVLLAVAGLTVGLVIGLVFASDIAHALERPYVQVMQNLNLRPDLNVLDVSQGFNIYLEIALDTAMLLASPWIFYQVWMFVAAGLYPNERKYVKYAVPASALLFLMGAAFYLLVVSKSIIAFLLGFSRYMGLVPMITFDNYISFMTTMMVIFGLGFQTPIVVLLLAKMGLVPLEMLRKYRKHVVVVLAILSAVLTPSPDFMSQLMLLGPMWLLYEIGVILVRVLVKPSAVVELETSPQPARVDE